MIIFRYFASHAFDTLRDCELLTTKLSRFNDPFESLYKITGEMTLDKARVRIRDRLSTTEFRNAIRARLPELRTDAEIIYYVNLHLETFAQSTVDGWKNSVSHSPEERDALTDETLRGVCFSSSSVSSVDEILLWSHYANKHHGVRIGFEFPEGIKSPFKVILMEYKLDRITIDFSNGTDTNEVDDALASTLRMKSIAWKYEGEHRLLTHPTLCIKKLLDDGSIGHLMPFERNWVKHVDFGLRCTKSNIDELVGLLAKEYPWVSPRKATCHHSEYSMEYTLINPAQS